MALELLAQPRDPEMTQMLRRAPRAHQAGHEDPFRVVGIFVKKQRAGEHD
jgi:hypothetical protein